MRVTGPMSEWMTKFCGGCGQEWACVCVYTETLSFCSFVVLNEQNATLFLEIPVLSGWKCFYS